MRDKIWIEFVAIIEEKPGSPSHPGIDTPALANRKNEPTPKVRGRHPRGIDQLPFHRKVVEEGKCNVEEYRLQACIHLEIPCPSFAVASKDEFPCSLGRYTHGN